RPAEEYEQAFGAEYAPPESAPSAPAAVYAEPAAGEDAADHLAAGHGMAEFVTIQVPGGTDSHSAPGEDLWPDLLPFGGPPPQCPREALPESLGAWVSAVATTTQTPADLAAGMALGAISASVIGKARVRVREGWDEELCAYVACVLPSGERKTPVVRLVGEPL